MNVYSIDQLENEALNCLGRIDKALVAGAIKIRDNARADFRNNGRYKGIGKLSEGIMIGKMKDHSIKIHGFGNRKENDGTWKTRFFILGTMYRRRKKRQPYPYKGFIQELETIDNAMTKANSILSLYIQHAIEGNKK